MGYQSSPAWRPPWRSLIPFVIVHSIVSVSVLLVAFTQGMARFDTGSEPSLVERAADFLSEILLSPLFMLVTNSRVLRAAFPGVLGWAPVLANSILWSFVAWWLIALGRRLTVRDSPN